MLHVLYLLAQSVFMYDMPMRFGYATLRRFLRSMHYCIISTQNVIASIDISISIDLIIIIIAFPFLFPVHPRSDTEECE